VGREDSHHGRASVPGRPPEPPADQEQEGYALPTPQPQQSPDRPAETPGPPGTAGHTYGRAADPDNALRTPTAGRAAVPLNTQRSRPTPDPPVPGIDPWHRPAAADPDPPRAAGAVVARAAVQPGAAAAAVPPHGPGAEPPGPRRNRRILIGLSALVLLLIAAGVLFVARPGPVDGWLAGDPAATATPSATPEPTPTPILAPADADAVAPSAAGVRSAISALVTAPALGSKVRVSVVDGATGDPLFERDADTMTTPASTTKLVTAAAVLAARGPAYRLSTRAVAGDEPGEVVLVGGGDPTLSIGAKGQFPGAARLDRLAAQVKKALGETAPAKVTIDTSLFTGPATGRGWSSTIIAPEGQVSAIQPLMTNAGRRKPVHNEVGGDPRFPDPALAAGQAFAKQLGVRAAVTRGKAPAAAAGAGAGTPQPGAELGRVDSPPMVHLVDWMLEQSDNTIAEVLSRQVALAAGKPASFTGATQAMIAELGELGLPANEIKLADASGLSRQNQISPSLLTDLLTLAASGKQPRLTPMFGGLPVAGWSGTLRTRFASPRSNEVGQGVVRAKTGSLSGVNAISGQLVTRDGRLLVFAILADDTGNSLAARAALDRIAARLVACGC
jgi:D-alanyl-D-alanine carboxypeptidase/D-alanyl-D-alanine-endopeptidase (penicillin-binding protein 4)